MAKVTRIKANDTPRKSEEVDEPAITRKKVVVKDKKSEKSKRKEAKAAEKKVSEGKVPSGAVIYVMADSYDAAANGYVINGGEAQNLGDSSVQITVTEDTKVFVQQPDPPEKTKKK